MDLVPGEDVHPVPEVVVVHADLDGLVARVHRPTVPADGDVLEGVQRLVLELLVVVDLRVVRYGPGGWVSHQNDQLDSVVHAVDAAGGDGGDEVAGRLLDGDLVRLRQRHVVAVPVQAHAVPLVVVEEVHLVLRRDDVRVEVEELQQGPRPALPDADDDARGQALGQRSVGHVGGQARPLLVLQQLPEAGAGQRVVQGVVVHAERRPHGAVAVKHDVEEGGQRQAHARPLTAPPHGRPAHPRGAASVGQREAGVGGFTARSLGHARLMVTTTIPGDETELAMGVPQGGGLGPSLFYVFTTQAGGRGSRKRVPRRRRPGVRPDRPG